MARIKFGTDGWRAVISEDFTFENVKVVAQAIADFVKSQKATAYKKPMIVVGYDTRFLSEAYAETVALVLAANGIRVILSDGHTPTPSVSFYIWRKKITGGVMITASHNPGKYNGIKYKDSYGGSAGNRIIEKIEKKLHRKKPRIMARDKALKDGLLAVEDILTPHLKFITKYVNMGLLKKARFNVLVDSMNGAGSDYIARLLKDTNIKTTILNGEKNPTFKGRSPEPNETQLKDFNNMVKKGRYDLGLATDGDADRLGVTASDGKFLTGHKIMALLLLHLIEDKKLKGSVVQTICGTMLINKICDKYGLKTKETPVGFKYICESLEKGGVLLGGEETGGIAYKNSIPERDGILSALLVLEMLAHRKKSINKLLKSIDSEYGTFEYKRLDLYYPLDKREPLLKTLKSNPFENILGKKVIDIKSYDGIKFIRQGNSWLMLRPSGTEPKLRIYAEAPTEKEAMRLLRFGRDFALKKK